jgi:hypothetical protein
MEQQLFPHPAKDVFERRHVLPLALRVQRLNLDNAVIQHVAVSLIRELVGLSLDSLLAARGALHGADHFVPTIEPEPTGSVVRINSPIERLNGLLPTWQRVQDAFAVPLDKGILRQRHSRGSSSRIAG